MERKEILKRLGYAALPAAKVRVIVDSIKFRAAFRIGTAAIPKNYQFFCNLRRPVNSSGNVCHCSLYGNIQRTRVIPLRFLNQKADAFAVGRVFFIGKPEGAGISMNRMRL